MLIYASVFEIFILYEICMSLLKFFVNVSKLFFVSFIKNEFYKTVFLTVLSLTFDFLKQFLFIKFFKLRYLSC